MKTTTLINLIRFLEKIFNKFIIVYLLNEDKITTELLKILIYTCEFDIE